MARQKQDKKKTGQRHNQFSSEGAIQGFGGCPMAKDTLTGNMPTEKLLSYFTSNKEQTNTSPMSFESAYNEATKLFGEFH